jgi:hypothetical protein
MAATPGGLTATIRRKLQDGKTPDEVVQELVAGGLGKASAQRFVDRALAEDASAGPLPPAPPMPDHAAPADGLDQFIQTKTAETEAENAKTGTRQLWIACALMCSGIAITGFSYIMAEPGERYTLMWGPVAFGFFLWGKSVVQGFANARSFAWVSAAASIALPVVLTVVTLGVVAATGAEPITNDNSEAELAQILETKSTPANRNAAIEQSYKDEFAARRASLDVDGLLARWDAASEEDDQDETRLKCDFAMQMAPYTGEHRKWLAQELADRIHGASDQVKICNAATALQLDWDTGIGIYQLWQNGDNPRLKSAATRAMARSAR